MKPLGHCQVKIPRKAFELDLDFSIPAQGVLGLFGPSGCGKTTVLRALAGLEKQQGIEITMKGLQWQNQQGFFVPPEKRNIAYVFQQSLLFPHLNVVENLNYALKRKQQNNNLNGHNFTEVVELLGIEGVLEQNVDELSGGEQQRVAIARALLRNPDLLLLDEPMASLDYARKQEIIPFLQRLHRELNIPIIYVSHDIDEILMLCDHIVIMNEGKALFKGPLDQALLASDSPLTKGDQVASIFYAKVKTNDGNHGVSEVVTANKNVFIINKNVTIDSNIRIILMANDISICLDKPLNTSILNVLKGRVDKVTETNQNECILLVSVNRDLFNVKISKKSFVDLKIHLDQELYLQIKANAIHHYC